MKLAPILQYMRKKDNEALYYHMVLAERDEVYFSPQCDYLYRRLLDIYETGGNPDYWAMIEMVCDREIKDEKRDEAYLKEVYDHFMKCTDGQFQWFENDFSGIPDYSLCESKIVTHLFFLNAYMDMHDLPGREKLYLFCDKYLDRFRKPGCQRYK